MKRSLDPHRGSRTGILRTAAAVLIAVPLLLAGCKGAVRPSERLVRSQFQSVQQQYRPTNAPPPIPALASNSPLADFLTAALLRQPRVEAAYYDWASAIERVTVERSLPDPRLTFKTDIDSTLVSLIPGLMMDLPGPGKLALRAEVASAASQVKYHAFESAVFQTAFDVKQSLIQSRLLDETLVVNRENQRLLTEIEGLARSQLEAGRGGLQDVLRAQTELDRVTARIANLEDSRAPILERFHAALGLRPADPKPPLPRQFDSPPPELNSTQLLATALARNPKLHAMEAEIRMAEAGVLLARKSRVPDFNAGLEVNAKAQPVMVTPQAGMTLPIWRDKLAAELASARAASQAASARLSAEQLQTAIDLADKLYTCRESARNLDVARRQLIPQTTLALEAARAAYLSGKTDFLNLIETERSLLDIQLSQAQDRAARDIALAELSLLILGQAPAQAPLLPSAR